MDHMGHERMKFKDVLRVRNFSLLWIGQIISNFGDRFNYMAVMGLILFKWEGSALDAGMMFIFMSLPALIFGPFAGVFVDRYNKKKVMIICDVIRAGLVGLLPFVSSLAQIYVIIFLISSVSRFFYPARSAIIPEIVESDKLLIANSLSQSTYQVSAIVGYAIGGALVAIVGPTSVFYMDGISYLISAFLIFNIVHNTRQKLPDMPRNTIGSVKNELVDGLRYSYNEKRVLFLLVSFTAVLLFFGGINILWIILVRDILGLGIEGMGVIESVVGVGMLFGTLVVGYVGHRFKVKTMIVGGFFVFSISFMAIGAWMTLLNAVVWVFMAGFSMSFVNIPGVTVFQKIVPEDMRGRVFSVLGTLTDVAALISMAIMGVLANVFSVQALLIASSIGMLTVAIVSAFTRINFEDDLEEAHLSLEMTSSGNPDN
ncbi:MAG: MFS transporter [Candidatus Methanofastidiosia archaeon]